MMRSSVAAVSESSGSTSCSREEASGELGRLLGRALAPARHPGVPRRAVEQARPPDVLHVPAGVLLAEEVAADVDLLDRVHGEGLVVDGDARGDRRTPREDLGVGDELAGREDGATGKGAGTRHESGAGEQAGEDGERALGASPPVDAGGRGREGAGGRRQAGAGQDLGRRDHEGRGLGADLGRPASAGHTGAK